MKNKSELAVKLIKLRKKMGVSSTVVADALGIKSATYRRYEIDTLPKPEVYSALAQYFNIPVSYLINEDEEEPETIKVEAPNTYEVTTEALDLSDAEQIILDKLRTLSADDVMDIINYINKKADE